MIYYVLFVKKIITGYTSSRLIELRVAIVGVFGINIQINFLKIFFKRNFLLFEYLKQKKFKENIIVVLYKTLLPLTGNC